jgi:hypothetical protein
MNSDAAMATIPVWVASVSPVQQQVRRAVTCHAAAVQLVALMESARLSAHRKMLNVRVTPVAVIWFVLRRNSVCVALSPARQLEKSVASMRRSVVTVSNASTVSVVVAVNPPVASRAKPAITISQETFSAVAS